MANSTTPQQPVNSFQPNEDNRKHLEFIQNVITRMNSNSFMIKGWAVTIVAALIALFASTKNFSFLAITILPIILFWVLDTKYLQMERKFRDLYTEVRKLNHLIDVYDMNFNHKDIPDNPKTSFFSAFGADTILPFYLLLLGLSAVGSTIVALQNNTKEDCVNVCVKGRVQIKSFENKKSSIGVDSIYIVDTMKTHKK